jgi:ABC-type sugar transport system ATPase subunit
MDYIVEMQDIYKEFPGVKALDNVQFNLIPGEVHVLLGENGAGKSTLMKILCGAYRKDAGVMKVDGKEYDFQNVKQSKLTGVNMIYQELNLLPNLSVMENVMFGDEIGAAGFINWKKMYQETKDILDSLHLKIDPKATLSTLGIGEQQMVEIAHAVSKNCKVIIMDEPTSALTEEETETLFALIGRLKKAKVGIVYISHRLEELLRIGDRVTVMRDGQYIETLDVKDENGNVAVELKDLINLMVGRELTQQYPKFDIEIGEETFRAEHISTETKVRDCTIYARRGEILGIAGLMGAGRTELARAIVGASSRTSGKIYVNGREVNTKTTLHAKQSKIGYLPEDRKKDGLVLGMSVSENITLANMEGVAKGPFISYPAEKEAAQKLADDLSVKTPDLAQQVKFLSGGNQQKVIIAKWLYTDCEILFFDEPTRGIDVGAKASIYTLVGELAKLGKTIIFISSEIPELFGVCDRIYIMHEGMINGEIGKDEFDQSLLLEYATGQKS